MTFSLDLSRRAVLRSAAAAFCLATLPGWQAAAGDPGTFAPNRFGTDVLKTLTHPGKNQLVSPLSLQTAVEVTRAGVENPPEEAQEPDATPATDAPSDSIEEPTETVDEEPSDAPDAGLSFANAVWLDTGITATPAALKTLDARWEIAPVTLDLVQEGVAEINAWADAATEGRISELLQSMPENTSLFITSALVFQDDWEKPFDPTLTEDGPFTLLDGTELTVPLMQSQESFPVWSFEGSLAAVLPFRKGLSMLLHLPAPVETAEAELDPDAAEAAETKAVYFPAEPLMQADAELRPLLLPKLTLSTDSDLSSALAALGLEEPLQEGLAALTTEPQRLGPVLQAVRLKVDEAGAEAAAVTSILATRSLAMPRPNALRFDRPFDLYIFDPSNGDVIIAAHIADPRG